MSILQRLDHSATEMMYFYMCSLKQHSFAFSTFLLSSTSDFCLHSFCLLARMKEPQCEFGQSSLHAHQLSPCLPPSIHPSKSSASDLLLLSTGWQIDCVELIEKRSLWGETVQLQPSVEMPTAVTLAHQGPSHASTHSGANVCKHSRGASRQI